MELEWLAASVIDGGRYPFALRDEGGGLVKKPLELDTRETIGAIVRDVHAGVPSAVVARRFHTTLADMIVHTCMHLREGNGISQVTLSGGVFMNLLLACDVETRLREVGF